MWRNSMSMEMQGMSMPMPGGAKETCVPVGKAQEAMAAPDKDCQVHDTQAAGNRFSAKFRCTGQQKMEGSMESVADGDRIRGTMRARSADGSDFTMKFDNTRLGKACEAIDYAGYRPPPPPQYATVDICKTAAEQFQRAELRSNNAPGAASPAFLRATPSTRKFAVTMDLHCCGATMTERVEMPTESTASTTRRVVPHRLAGRLLRQTQRQRKRLPP
jgi:hypothetical protein